MWTGGVRIVVLLALDEKGQEQYEHEAKLGSFGKPGSPGLCGCTVVIRVLSDLGSLITNDVISKECLRVQTLLFFSLPARAASGHAGVRRRSATSLTA